MKIIINENQFKGFILKEYLDKQYRNAVISIFSNE